MIQEYMKSNKKPNLVQYNLLKMIKDKKLIVHGSESYNEQFGPQEACNPS